MARIPPYELRPAVPSGKTPSGYIEQDWLWEDLDEGGSGELSVTSVMAFGKVWVYSRGQTRGSVKAHNVVARSSPVELWDSGAYPQSAEDWTIENGGNAIITEESWQTDPHYYDWWDGLMEYWVANNGSDPNIRNWKYKNNQMASTSAWFEEATQTVWLTMKTKFIISYEKFESNEWKSAERQYTQNWLWESQDGVNFHSPAPMVNSSGAFLTYSSAGYLKPSSGTSEWLCVDYNQIELDETDHPGGYRNNWLRTRLRELKLENLGDEEGGADRYTNFPGILVPKGARVWESTGTTERFLVPPTSGAGPGLQSTYGGGGWRGNITSFMAEEDGWLYVFMWTLTMEIIQGKAYDAQKHTDPKGDLDEETGKYEQYDVHFGDNPECVMCYRVPLSQYNDPNAWQASPNNPVFVRHSRQNAGWGIVLNAMASGLHGVYEGTYNSAFEHGSDIYTEIRDVHYGKYGATPEGAISATYIAPTGMQGFSDLFIADIPENVAARLMSAASGKYLANGQGGEGDIGMIDEDIPTWRTIQWLHRWKEFHRIDRADDGSMSGFLEPYWADWEAFKAGSPVTFQSQRYWYDEVGGPKDETNPVYFGPGSIPAGTEKTNVKLGQPPRRQQWWLVREGYYYLIMNRFSGQFLTASGEDVTLTPLTKDMNQYWKIEIV